jgi:hypothetical protein
MVPSFNLAKISQIRDLITTPLVLEILDGLGQGRTPSQTAPAGTDAATVEAALAMLLQVGAIAGAGDDCGLTARGRQLLAAFEEADDLRDESGPDQANA